MVNLEPFSVPPLGPAVPSEPPPATSATGTASSAFQRFRDKNLTATMKRFTGTGVGGPGTGAGGGATPYPPGTENLFRVSAAPDSATSLPAGSESTAVSNSGQDPTQTASTAFATRHLLSFTYGAMPFACVLTSLKVFVVMTLL